MGTYVYVVTSDEKGAVAQMRPVTLGQRHGDLVVISQGVAAGARVVTTGQMNVAPGAPVRVLEPAPAGPPAAGGAAAH
jgi:multidrug efflux pump subunit AcrA (membrane-fusion protein)